MRGNDPTMNALEQLPWLRPFTEADRVPLARAMAEDNHDPALFPTHVITRAGELIGEVSVGPVVCLLVWSHTKKLRPRESLSLLNLVENTARLAGHTAAVLPCPRNSPFYPYMEAFGYTKGTAELFIKQLR